VRTVYFERDPYIEITPGVGQAFDLTCTDAMNLALMLISEAGSALSRQAAQYRDGRDGPSDDA
jgi:hypothetical protein